LTFELKKRILVHDVIRMDRKLFLKTVKAVVNYICICSDHPAGWSYSQGKYMLRPLPSYCHPVLIPLCWKLWYFAIWSSVDGWKGNTTNSDQSHTSVWNRLGKPYTPGQTRDGIRCLGGIRIPCRTVTPAVIPISKSGKQSNL
jgi:hypothetical protein